MRDGPSRAPPGCGEPHRMGPATASRPMVCLSVSVSVSFFVFLFVSVYTSAYLKRTLASLLPLTSSRWRRCFGGCAGRGAFARHGLAARGEIRRWRWRCAVVLLGISEGEAAVIPAGGILYSLRRRACSRWLCSTGFAGLALLRDVSAVQRRVGARERCQRCTAWRACQCFPGVLIQRCTEAVGRMDGRMDASPM